MSDDGKTVSTARVVELEMQVVSCRAAKERAAALEAGLREWVAASNRLSFSFPDYPLHAERRWRQSYDAARRLLGEG